MLFITFFTIGFLVGMHLYIKSTFKKELENLNHHKYKVIICPPHTWSVNPETKMLQCIECNLVEGIK